MKRAIVALVLVLFPAVAGAQCRAQDLIGLGINDVKARALGCDNLVGNVAITGTLTSSSTLTTTAGGHTITAGGLLVSAGHIRNKLSVTNNDAQNNTLTVAELVGGITVHTSTTGGGTVTTDTAVNIIAGSGGVGALTADGQCYEHYYINDGDQTLTFAGGTGVTISDTGQTVGSDESALLLVCRASSTTVTVYIIGG